MKYSNFNFKLKIKIKDMSFSTDVVEKQTANYKLYVRQAIAQTVTRTNLAYSYRFFNTSRVLKGNFIKHVKL
jgi:hypothetical protein